MQRRVIRMLLVVLLGLLGGYVGGGLLLLAFQDRLLFPVPGGIGRDSLDANATELGAIPLDLEASDGVRLYAWNLRSNGNRLLVYLHGNGEVIADATPLYRILMRDGWDVLSIAYRGYPGSEGSPSEAGLGRDAEAAWLWAIGPGGYAPERIVVHGRSLGGGVAAILVDGDANPAGLVMESTFASVRELAHRMLRNPFDTRARAWRLGVPVLLMHSRDDQVIPVDLGGRALRGLFAEVEYHETAGYPHQVCLPCADRSIRKIYLDFLNRVVPR
jgi:fermentation-respiration switch protein FrsA (DUF1100 family)